jgi:hypothetical protein
MLAYMTEAATAYHVPVTAIERVVTAAKGQGGIGPMGIPKRWLPVKALYTDHDMVINDGAETATEYDHYQLNKGFDVVIGCVLSCSPANECRGFITLIKRRAES